MKEIFVMLRQRLGTTQLARRLYRHLPSGKRCKECLVPFVGVFAVPFRKGKSEPVVAWQVEAKPVPTRRTSD
jgi:hypothetical protein